MRIIVRLAALLIFLASVAWVIAEPKMQSVFACLIAVTMFAVTFLKRHRQLAKIIAVIALIGSGLWAIFDFPSLDPIVGLTGALLVYVSTILTPNEKSLESNPSETQPPILLSETLGPPDIIKGKLEMAKRSLTILEKQAAGHTILTLPAHLQIELEEKRKEVQRLEQRLKGTTGN